MTYLSTSGIETEAEPLSPFLSLPWNARRFVVAVSLGAPAPAVRWTVTPGRNGERLNFRGWGPRGSGSAAPGAAPSARPAPSPLPLFNPTLVDPLELLVVVVSREVSSGFLPRLLFS